MDGALTSALMAAQRLLVLRPIKGGLVRVVPPGPDWLERLQTRPGAADAPFPLTEVFPFLESWVGEAEAAWQSAESRIAQSPLWTEPTSDGGEIHLEALALGVAQGALLVIREAGAEHAARHEVLQAARMAALEHERLLAEISEKDVLLHCLIHDLAGPLTAMQGCLEMLSRTPQTPEGVELLQLARLQTDRQYRLVRDMLDVFAAQVAALGRFVTDATLAPDLVHCVSLVTDGLRAAFEIKGVRIRTVVPGGPPGRCRVIAEQARLERVLYNLLENALRFAPRSSEVTVEVAEEDSWLRLSVMDQGAGVRPEILPRLFQRFVSGGRAPGKAGLGLFFCRISVERWGGTITCESGVSPGARFSIRLQKPVMADAIRPEGSLMQTPGTA